jgi:hypothetical protein
MVKLNTDLKLAASFDAAQTETDRRGIAGFQPVVFRHFAETRICAAARAIRIRTQYSESVRSLWRGRCPHSRAELRIKSMAGRRTKYRPRALGPQAPPARPVENIEAGGTKIGVKSGAQKSERTRTKRRSAGVR